MAISNGHVGTISTHQQLAVGWDSVVMAVEFLSFYHGSCIIFCTSFLVVLTFYGKVGVLKI